MNKILTIFSLLIASHAYCLPDDDFYDAFEILEDQSVKLMLSTHPLDDLLVIADSSYNKGKYDITIACYEIILDQGLENAEMYFNLGCCHFQLRQYKKSKSYFYKSLALNEDLNISQKNITLCNTKMLKREMPEPFYINWWNNILNILTLKYWIILSYIAMAILTILTILKLYKKKNIPTGIIILIIMTNVMIYVLVTSKQKKMYEVFKQNDVSINKDQELNI